MSDSNDMWESPGSGTGEAQENSMDTSGFSEHELLDIMYNTCDNANSGQVTPSTIIQYLQSMTAAAPAQERLIALRQQLDPDCQDPIVSRETFHLSMREWIAQCSQDITDVDGTSATYSDSPEMSASVMDFPCLQSKVASSESQPCTCDGEDLSGTVVELKQAHRKLSEQNSSLLRTVAQCEDINLQLTLEITELRAKLARNQRSAVRIRSLTEELEETRRAFKEAQEKASRTQSSCNKLSNEVECLKAHIRRLEDKNEKLTFERTCSEDSINKLRKVNAELRADLQESLVLLSLREREITKKDILMSKIKSSHMENHNIIEGLQSELTRLKEHSHHVLLRYDRICISPKSLYCRDSSNLRSLQNEMQDMQQTHHRILDDASLPSIHTHSSDLHSIINRIKSAELGHLLHNKHPERDSAYAETQDVFPHQQQQQQQAHIKQQLVNVLQELELQKCMWEENGEKVDERLRACEKEQNQSQTGNPTQIQQSKKVAIVQWWKALSVEGTKAQKKKAEPTHDPSESARIQQAEQTISDMREQICHLPASLESAQKCAAEHKNCSKVLLIHKETNTEIEEVNQKQVKETRDAAVVTDPVHITGGAATEQEHAKLRGSADGLLVTLRRMEAMVKGALETAELVKKSEQRVSQVREKMEIIGRTVEVALGRTADTDKQLSSLEASITERAPIQLPDSKVSADPLTVTAGCVTESNEEAKGGDREESPPPPPVIPEVIEPAELPMNGMMAASQRQSVSG